MKKYEELMALSKDERAADLKQSAEMAVHMTDAKIMTKKHAAKTMAAMKARDEIADGDMAKHGKEITGMDIRRVMQGIYELTNVFVAIAKGGIIDITEAEFDTLDASKLELLSPMLADDASEELKAQLPKAVELVKKGTAREIRELKGAPPEPKKVREAKEAQAKAEERAAKAEKTLENIFEKGTAIHFGFMATDITADQALVHSEQFGKRIRTDMARAMDAKDDATFMKMIEKFGKFYAAACTAMDVDPLDFLAELAAKDAKPAAGQVIEVPALEVGAAA